MKLANVQRLSGITQSGNPRDVCQGDWLVIGCSKATVFAVIEGVEPKTFHGSSSDVRHMLMRA